MFDFSITSITREGLIICTLLYFFIFFNYWRKSTCLNCDSHKLNIGLFFLILIFSVISWYNGDWFHYQHYVETTAWTKNGSGMESFYDYLVIFIRRNYLLFRIIVWGSALTLFCFSLRNLNININCALILLLIVFITYFDYSRTALGVAVYFYGLSLVSKKTSIIKIIIGVAIICCAVFFHRSTILLTCLTLTYVFPINKKSILLIIVIVVSFYSILRGFFIDFMTDIIENDNELSGKAEFYMKGKRFDLVAGNINGIIIGLWTYSVFYVFFIVDSICFFKRDNFVRIPGSIAVVYKILFGLMLFSTLMYFFQVGHAAFYYRFLSMTYFPLVIITTYLYSERMMNKRTFKNLCLYVGGNVAIIFLYRCMIGA